MGNGEWGIGNYLPLPSFLSPFLNLYKTYKLEAHYVILSETKNLKVLPQRLEYVSPVRSNLLPSSW
jgi:hypothetical protein